MQVFHTMAEAFGAFGRPPVLQGCRVIGYRFGGVAVSAAASTWEFPKIRDPIGDDYMGFRVSGPHAWKLPHLDL